MNLIKETKHLLREAENIPVANKVAVYFIWCFTVLVTSVMAW